MTVEPWEKPEELRQQSRALDVVLAIFLVFGYGAPITFGLPVLLTYVAKQGVFSGFAFPLGILCIILLTIGVYRRMRQTERHPFIVAAEILVLCILPMWGLGYSHWIGQADCHVSSCDTDTATFRVFAEPEIYGLAALHLLTALAYAISRRRPERLRPAAEVLVHATLLVGIFMQTLVAIHIVRWLGVGVVLAPVFLPCVAPLCSVVLYMVELRGRLRRRGFEADTPPPLETGAVPYRSSGPQEQLMPEPRVHRPTFFRAIALTPILLGAHAVIQALWFGHPDAALGVFTRTCGYVLSDMPTIVVPQDCHYLCTVAARGHTWLVKPERLGRRGGVTIVVNRQLATANAFEDLLHERFPRVGRVARRIYDRLGLPVSRYLHRRVLADATYLLMKPAEWLFYVVLLLVDRGDPEDRIDRMYR